MEVLETLIAHFIEYFIIFHRVSKSRELEVSVYWRDWRQMCAVKFLRLEDFLDNQRHGITLHLEPKGILFCEVGPSYICKARRLFI